MIAFFYPCVQATKFTRRVAFITITDMGPDFLIVLDVLGIISFTITGSLTAIRKKMDYMGVCILGIVASTGGGVIRDLIIGRTPPVIFTDYQYLIISFATATVVFLVCYFHLQASAHRKHVLEYLISVFDSFGLAFFTINGVIIGEDINGGIFLCCFLGVVTGVGGGVLRDVLAMEVPMIFVKYVYAAASLAGALTTCLLWNVNSYLASVLGFAVIVLIRFLAMHYHWNLPRVV